MSGVLTPQVLIFPSGWQLADSVSRYQKKRGPIMLGGQQNTMGLLEQSVEDQLGGSMVGLDFCCLRLSMALAVYRW